MTSTRIELAFNKIARLRDVSDLAELLFPHNRNQQHGCLVLWFAVKWAGPNLVPSLRDAAQERGVSRRTLERVRAKLRRLGLLDHVSRFNRQYGYREGWILSGRFERSLRQLADQVAALREASDSRRAADERQIAFAAAQLQAAVRQRARE